MARTASAAHDSALGRLCDDSSERFSTGGYALATRTLHLSSDVPGFLSGGDWLGGVRIRGESANPARPLFIGIARKQDVDRYLTGVARSDVVDVTANPLGTSYRPSYRTQAGGKPATPPGRAKFWVASVAGRGNQALTWSVKHGRWAIVVMRPDGARGVSADLLRAPSCRRSCGHRSACSCSGYSPWAARAALIYFGACGRRAPAPPAARRTPSGDR